MKAFVAALFFMSLVDCAISVKCRYPSWPSEFKWSSAGSVDGMACVQILETADPHTWRDNYFCHKSDVEITGIGMRWSGAGPISGMKCTHIHESADPHTWHDNYLCVPHNSPYQFLWSSDGPIHGKHCIQWLEPSDPHTWEDNYLCA